MDLNWKLADTLGQRSRLVIWETLPARDTADWYNQGSTCTELAALPLSFAEGCDLIDQVAGFSALPPSLLLIGDDPLQRPDLCDLVRYATRHELPVTTSLCGSWDEPLCAYEPGTFPFVSDVLALVGINRADVR